MQAHGVEGINNGLMNEVRRLSNVVMLGDNGWMTIPYQDAVNKQLIAQDDIDEIEGNIIFFICASAVHKRNLIAGVLAMMSNLWGTQTTSLNCTEFGRLLPTPTAVENIGATAPQSSIPS